MTFHASLFLLDFCASVTRPPLPTLVVHITSFHAVFPSIIQVDTRCSSFSLLTFTWLKTVVQRLRILFISNLVVSASRNTVSFDFFLVHEIHSILRRNHNSVSSNFFCNCFEIIEASYPYIRMGSLMHSRALLLGGIENLLALISFSGNLFLLALFLMQFQCYRVHRLILMYPTSI